MTTTSARLIGAAETPNANIETKIAEGSTFNIGLIPTPVP
jgi:hypothetical protein